MPISLEKQIENMRERAMPVVEDEPNTHSEFVTKQDGTILHGIKHDWDAIDRRSLLFSMVCNTMARFLVERGGDFKMLVGIANGANSLALGIRESLVNDYRRPVEVITSQKDKSGRVFLGEKALELLQPLDPDSLIEFIEDVGTTGTTSEMVVSQVRSEGFSNVHVTHLEQRSSGLWVLDQADPPIPYDSVLINPMQDYEAEQCRSDGYCAQGYDLKLYASS